MYYEIHGEGPPLLLLHGAYMTIDTMGPLLPGLAASRQVIAVEQQAHGHTADIDRPISYEQMADDTRRAARSPRHRPRPTSSATAWAAASPSSWRSGIPAWCASWWSPRRPTPATACTPWRSRCSRRSRRRCSPARRSRRPTSAPRRTPADFPTLVEKLKQLDTTPFAWPAEDIRGDRRAHADRARGLGRRPLEHAVELFGLLGGGVMGDLAGLPDVAARRAARHHPLRAARLRAARSRRTGCWP